MLYFVHDDEGRGLQSNKVFDHQGYDKLLSERGYKFVAVDSARVLSLDDWRVSNGELVKIEDMAIEVARTTIKAGESDAAVFSGLPQPCSMEVWVLGQVLIRETVVDGSVDLSVPVPGFYKVRFAQWPWRPKEFQIEAVQ
jgi:hypothetical protein